jgi:murein DD-endopeptidase MepM/ murein hydrolase activator NlpD
MSTLLVAAVVSWHFWPDSPPASQNPQPVRTAADSLSGPPQASTPERWYGIFPKSRFLRHDSVIQRGEVLSEILTPYRVSSLEIQRLAEAAEGVFSVRRLRVGHPYSIIAPRARPDSAVAFVYHPNAVNYVVFRLRDSLSVQRYRHKIDTILCAAAGEINNSVYQSMSERGYPIDLISKMEKIFAWQVDFFHIAKRDQYKMVYEQLQVKGKPVGVGRVHAAVFKHKRTSFSAFAFERDSTLQYFNEKGESVRKAFLKAPLEYSRISSRYTPRRFHPVLKRVKAHLGTDYAAPPGTPIYSVGDGNIVAAKYSRYNGYYVKVRHNSTYTTQYLHMSKIAKGMHRGKRVEQGEVIGYVGSTGLATGPHLCYRFWMNGRQVDPYKVKIPPAEPLPDTEMPEFKIVRAKWQEALDTVSVQATLAS